MKFKPLRRTDKARLSLGTLGGGNHFIEVDKDDDNNLYIVIHTGSRHLGKIVRGNPVRVYKGMGFTQTK